MVYSPVSFQTHVEMLHIIRARRQRQKGQPESDKRGPPDVHAMNSNTGCQPLNKKA